MTTEALTAIKAALAAGRWEASVYHCPPPRRKTDNPLKHASMLRLTHGLPSEAVALSEAKAAIESGWGSTTSIHRETAQPSASFYLPHDHLAALGRELPALLSSYEAMERRVAELEDKVEGLDADLRNAVVVAYKRGAVEWARLNYPDIYAALSQSQTVGTPAPEAHVMGANLADRLRYEADAMYAAINGKDYGDTFHHHNWNDKPHRVVYDAVKLLREAADFITPPPQPREVGTE